MTAGGSSSERVLVLSPLGRDAEVAVALLREAWISGQGCPDLAWLCRELDQGAGMAIIAEEAVATADLRPLDSMDWN